MNNFNFLKDFIYSKKTMKLDFECIMARWQQINKVENFVC